MFMDTVYYDEALEHARERGEASMAEIEDLLAGVPSELRIVEGPPARTLVNLAREEGILIGTDGPYDNVVKMRPAMIFTRRDADLLCDVLDQAFARAAAEA